MSSGLLDDLFMVNTMVQKFLTQDDIFIHHDNMKLIFTAWMTFMPMIIFF